MYRTNRRACAFAERAGAATSSRLGESPSTGLIRVPGNASGRVEPWAKAMAGPDRESG
ncbi:hypothetical protein [Streptomyces sp. NPDC093991]|uniref:hypothetical protein n=1 Tax=unclassified Streptomyces TaxID=2593676 RepID=UPI00343E2867